MDIDLQPVIDILTSPHAQEWNRYCDHHTRDHRVWSKPRDLSIITRNNEQAGEEDPQHGMNHFLTLNQAPYNTNAAQ